MSEYSVNLGLPAQPLTDDLKLFGELMRVYNAIRNLNHAHDIVTGVIQPPAEDWSQLGATRFSVGGMTKVYLTAFENLSYGNAVAIYNDAGVGKARKALDGTYFAVGFCSQTAGATAGQPTEITLLGRYPVLPPGTLTIGAKYYLSNAVAGTITATPTTQVIGVSVSDTQLIWMPQL